MRYDAIVVGSGTGGYPAAMYLADKGLKVAVVEQHLVGGECTNYGCIPSKALYNIAEGLRLLEKVGASASYSWGSVIEWVKGVVKESREGIEHLFESRGISLYRGRGLLKGAKRLVVELPGGFQELEAERVLLALGTDPADIPPARFDGFGIVSNREALYFEEKPESLLIIGGGVVGVELANAFSAFKIQVTVVEIMEHILPFTDRDVALAVKTHLQQRGVRILEKTSVKKVERTGSKYVAELTTGEKLEVDKVVVATGRRPKTRGVGLEAAGVEVDERGFIKVDKQMRTSAPGVYAAGDVVGGPLLAHKAILESIAAAKNMLGEESFEVDYRLVPITIFSGLEVASIGYTEKELSSMGLKYARVRMPLAYLSAVRVKGYKSGFVKVLFSEDYSSVYGVHIVSPGASEVISSYMPLYMGLLKLKDAKKAPYPHLTVSESLRDLAEYVLGEPIHLLKK